MYRWIVTFLTMFWPPQEDEQNQQKLGTTVVRPKFSVILKHSLLTILRVSSSLKLYTVNSVSYKFHNICLDLKNCIEGCTKEGVTLNNVAKSLKYPFSNVYIE